MTPDPAPTETPRKPTWLNANWFPVLALAAIVVLFLAQRQSPYKSAVDWGHDLPKALSVAAEQDRPVLISFTSPACTYCQQMEAEVIPQEAVLAEIEQYVPVKIDAWADPRTAERYGVSALPAYVVTRADGTPVVAASGFIEADRFARFLQKAREEAAPAK
jgi:hypothetical protein